MFLIFYIVLCILWSIFCLRAQHCMYGTRLKDFWVIILNLIFTPISMLLAIKRIPKDFSSRKL